MTQYILYNILCRLLHYDDRVLDLVSQWKRFQGEDDTSGEFIKFVYKVPPLLFEPIIMIIIITSNIRVGIFIIVDHLELYLQQ